MQLIRSNQLQTLTNFMKLWGFRLVAGEWQRGEAASGSGGSGVRQATLK
jgi:hypothetical protein